VKEERRRVLSVTAADCDLQTFRCGGNGGQNVNTRDTGVRWIHRESGARGEARDERSQLQNKRLAWRRMFNDPRFQLWLRRTLGQEMAREAELERMPREDFKFEVRRQGRWVQVDEASLSA
jgi:protein subunit release factor B